MYLFEMNIPPLQVQKHNRELEIIVQEAILNTLRESVPVETILKAYLDETVEENVVDEIKEQILEVPVPQQRSQETTGNVSNDIKTEIASGDKSLSFNSIDYVRDENNNEVAVTAPKTIERLEEISEMRNMQRKMESEQDDPMEKLNITNESVELGGLDVHLIEEPKLNLLPDLLMDDIEILE